MGIKNTHKNTIFLVVCEYSVCYLVVIWSSMYTLSIIHVNLCIFEGVFNSHDFKILKIVFMNEFVERLLVLGVFPLK